MFSAEILQKIYCDENMQGIPVCYQSTVVRVIERVLKEAEDVPISQLSDLSTTKTNVSE